ncbi:SDR family oxidoreductase [Neptunicella marina]|uniref:SDR family oxidoreductase n=1 Tax=Neptunicella marina TaxID=2125989 RepID=A0A8J6ITS1_9ALTE|nr:SDR family oxidoreductase [Neptunicella marina]MBC3767245.1 SDR family oxidoreductase [Neptunicella marina]
MSHSIALITGGSRGLGASAALHLAKQGIDSVITYQSNRDKALEVITEVNKLGAKAVALQLDTEKAETFADFAKDLNNALQEHWQTERFNFLLNNAGIGLHATFAETTEAQFDQLMNIHLKGVFFLTQSLLGSITDGGRILNVSTGLTRFSVPGYAAYAMMKGGIEVLTQYLAKELGARGISVNVLAPGAIETDFRGGAVRDDKQMNAFLASQTALGRVGLPDDIGGVVASLLAGDNHWITAQRIEASGGMFI